TVASSRYVVYFTEGPSFERLSHPVQRGMTQSVNIHDRGPMLRDSADPSASSSPSTVWAICSVRRPPSGLDAPRVQVQRSRPSNWCRFGRSEERRVGERV